MKDFELSEKDIETLKNLKNYASEDDLIKYVKTLVSYAYNIGVARRCENELTQLNENLN